jgi:hypothetical protein
MKRYTSPQRVRRHPYFSQATMPRSVFRAATQEPAQGRLGPPNRQELLKLPPSMLCCTHAPLCGRVSQKRKRCGAHPQTDRAAFRFACVPQKPAQVRLGPPNRQELLKLPPSMLCCTHAPLCGRVPQKPAKGAAAPSLQPSNNARRTPFCGRVPQKYGTGLISWASATISRG